MTCAQSLPFFGDALNSDYANAIGSQSYIGFADTTLFCHLPFKVGPHTRGEMSDATYSCPAENLPFQYDGWNEKWLSIACRTWFKGQKEKPDQNTVSDLYLFASQKVLGLTNCAPVLKEDSQGKTDFHGTICLDIDPSGSLNEFFTFEYDKKYATYLMFNDDEAFDSITRVDESEFKTYVEDIVGSRIRAAGDWISVKISEIKAWAKRARIYDNKHVTWGRVDFDLSNSLDGRQEDIKLFFVVENTFVDFRKFELEPPPGK